MDAETAGLDAKMDYEKVSGCPKGWPCPHCGKRGKRKQRLPASRSGSAGHGLVPPLGLGAVQRHAVCRRVALGTLRTFTNKAFALFSGDQSRQQAGCRRSALAGTASFQTIPELAKAMEMLSPQKFDKMMSLLLSPAGEQVRTNNHVERANRKLRYFEKVRYKWRRRRSIVRFILLSLQRWWKDHPPSKPHAPGQRPTDKANPPPNNCHALSG